MVVNDSERQDFVAIIKAQGFAAEDFELVPTPEPATADQYPVRGVVTVRHKKTGAGRDYVCGHGHAWVVEFERDLKAGFYR